MHVLAALRPVAGMDEGVNLPVIGHRVEGFERGQLLELRAAVGVGHDPEPDVVLAEVHRDLAVTSFWDYQATLLDGEVDAAGVELGGKALEFGEFRRATRLGG